MAEVRIHCPSCQSADTWATYECNPCGGFSSPTIWTEEAMGPTPDSAPSTRPCRQPGCGKTVPAKSVKCNACDHVWNP